MNIDGLRALCASEWPAHADFDALCTQMAERLAQGDAPRWQAAIDGLPDLVADTCDLAADAVRVGGDVLDPVQRDACIQQLKQLHPWRKGPFNFFGIPIDCEWRSDWKWQRIAPHLSDLTDRRVLDVGCGNGYHLWRMRAAGARAVVGIDPMPLFAKQFLLMSQYINDPQVQFALSTLETWPESFNQFDSIFSMGVFYHRRSAFEHIYQLRSLLRSDGEMILETLVIDGDEQAVLLPEDRYAKMRNVWLIPSVTFLLRGLERCGLKDVRCVNECVTTVEEQRKTDWMEWESLSDFLDPQDPSKTIEGHPAPKRAVFIARVP